MTKKNVTQSIVSEQEFQELVHPLIGLPVSQVWRGGGTAILLEIGQLFRETWCGRKTGKKQTSIVGRFGVMIEWSWRIERARSVYFGSWSSDRVIDNRLPKLKGQTVTFINVEGRLPELIIQLSGGLWVHSFATEEGQPQWCVFLDRRQSPSSWLVTIRGKLIEETAERESSIHRVLTPLRTARA